MKGNKSKQILFSVFGILSLLVITIGVTYAVFSYTKEGTTDNVVTSGTLKFLYTENSAGGTGINISEAEPISDTQGKELVGDNNVFDFKVEGTNTGSEVIPYEVTLRKKDTSTMSEDNIKVYLQDGTDQTDLLTPTLYSKLMQTNIDVGSNIEKTLYKGEVLGNTNNYLKTFRLRMWIDENSNQNDINGKSFTATVNVYSNAKVLEDTTKYFKNVLLNKNTIIEAEPTLTTSSNNTTDASGLYKSTDTNTGDPTYYFRGNVENNYVSFAGFTWRMVRINEDGTIRMIMQDGINNNATYKFNSNYNNFTYMYYSNSEAKTILENWYNTNIGTNEQYSKYVATGNYFCEQAKTKGGTDWITGQASVSVFTAYTPDFRCSVDENGKGLVNASVGLLTYDEVVSAGGYWNQKNQHFYLYSSNVTAWTMSPAGYDPNNSQAHVWGIYDDAIIDRGAVYSNPHMYKPIINIKSNITVSGSGTSTDPFIVGEA